MNYAFLNASGDVLGLSTSDISVEQAQSKNPDISERIENAPEGLLLKTTVSSSQPDYSRKTSGDGTHIEDYTEVPGTIPPVVHDASNAHAESVGVSSTDETGYRDKAVLTAKVTTSGKYRVEFSSLISAMKYQFGIPCRVSIDGGSVYNSVIKRTMVNEIWDTYNGFFFVDLDTGDMTIRLQYCAEKAGRSVCIKEAMLSTHLAG